MISKKRLADELPAELPPGEQVLYVTHGQPKGGGARNATKTAVATVAFTAATMALSGGAVGGSLVFSTKPVWIVVTTSRVLLVRREGFQPLAQRFLAAIPRAGLAARRRGHLLQELTLTDRETGDALRFNLGSRPRVAGEVVAVLEGTTPGMTRY